MVSKQDYHRRPLPLRRNREDPMRPEPEWIGEISCLIAAGSPAKGSCLLSAASDKGALCQPIPGCPGFAAKPRLIVDFTANPPREVPVIANLGPGPAKSYEMYGSSNAGDAWAIGGGREGRPRQVRIFRIAAGRWTAQRTFMRPPQRSHTKTSTK